MGRPAHARIEPRFTASVEQRAFDPSWGAVALGAGSSPGTHLAESLSAVLGCVELVANAAASLPASIVMDTPDGRVPAPSTLPAWRVLQRPNARQSWPALITSLVASTLLRGNGLARITTDGRGAVTALTPIPWGWINPQTVQSAAGARLVFDVLHATPEAALLGLPPRLLESDVLHIRARSDTGIIGRSVLSRASGVVAEGHELNTVALASWKNGMRPSGALTTDQALKQEQRDRLKVRMQDYQGSANVGKMLVLESGLSWNGFAMPPSEAQLLETRAFSVGEICRLFCVPEVLLQFGTRVPPSLTPFLAAFAQMALSPIVSVIEGEFDAAVLPPGYHLQLDMSGLLRGDYASIAAANAVLVQSGTATPNDARRALGLPAHDAGDDLRAGPAPCQIASKAVPCLECAPAGGQNQAAVLTVCRAC